MTRRNLLQGVAAVFGASLLPWTAVSAPEPVVTAPEVLPPVCTNILSQEAPADLTIESLEAALQQWKAEYPYRQMGLMVPVKAVGPFDDFLERGIRKVYLTETPLDNDAKRVLYGNLWDLYE